MVERTDKCRNKVNLMVTIRDGTVRHLHSRLRRTYTYIDFETEVQGCDPSPQMPQYRLVWVGNTRCPIMLKCAFAGTACFNLSVRTTPVDTLIAMLFQHLAKGMHSTCS
jgi:hypothetical protein